MTDSILSRRERAKMQDLITHSHDGRLSLRAYALLWLDDGESVPEIAQRLGVTRQTVYNWASRCAASRIPPNEASAHAAQCPFPPPGPCRGVRL